MGVSIGAVVKAAMLPKCIRVITSEKQCCTTGELVNVMSKDTERMHQVSSSLHVLWVGPLVKIAATGLMLFEMSVPALGGVRRLFLMVAVQGGVARAIGRNGRGVLKHTDERVKVMKEMLTGIRMVKL